MGKFSCSEVIADSINKIEVNANINHREYTKDQLANILELMLFGFNFKRAEKYKFESRDYIILLKNITL